MLKPAKANGMLQITQINSRKFCKSSQSSQEMKTPSFGGYQRFPTGARGNPKSSACGARCLLRRSKPTKSASKRRQEERRRQHSLVFQESLLLPFTQSWWPTKESASGNNLHASVLSLASACLTLSVSLSICFWKLFWFSASYMCLSSL